MRAVHPFTFLSFTSLCHWLLDEAKIKQNFKYLRLSITEYLLDPETVTITCCGDQISLESRVIDDGIVMSH